MFEINNAHERTFEANSESVGVLLDRLAGRSDALWPSPRWPPLKLDRPLGVGASGGHGPIPYTVSAYEPGRRLRFEFEPRLGITGYHEAVVESRGPQECTLRHVLRGRPNNALAYLRWSAAIRFLHDALIEDLLDNAERICTGRVRSPARWSPWVRGLRRVVARGSRGRHRGRRSTRPGSDQ